MMLAGREKSALFFDLSPSHKAELSEYFIKMDKLKINYDLFVETDNENPMMCEKWNCVYSLELIKKSLDLILQATK